MLTKEICPGSCEENPHNLSIFSDITGNKICDNGRCYFMYIDKNSVGVWQTGFDPLKASTFLKPIKEEIKSE